MAEDFQSFVERVKSASANALEDVIEATGAEFRLERRRGRYLRGAERGKHSLVVRTDLQYYVWNAQGGERGDVFTWLEKRKHWDFWECLEWLAQRAGMEMPHWQRTETDVAERMSARQREDVLGVAQAWFAARLWEDVEALAYARGRGWLDETIRLAGLGFSGRASSGELKDLRGEFSLHNIDPESPVAVAVLGFRGDVAGWARQWNVDAQDNWLEWGFVPGMAGKTRLVFPHIWTGRVRYLSGRNIMGAQINKEGREVKSYNLPVALAGPRQVYYNHVYGRKAEECVLIEGPACAVSLGQWEIPAMAIIGTAWNDYADLLREMRERHDHLYLGLDNDDAGEQSLVGHERDWPLAQLLGGMARVARWPKKKWTDGEQEKEVKDANDLLQWMARGEGMHVGPAEDGQDEEQRQEQVDQVVDAQTKVVRELLNGAPTFAETVAAWAGNQKGPRRDEAFGLAFKIIADLTDQQRSMHRSSLVRLLGITVREFGDILKSVGKKDEAAAQDFVETLGGYFDGWLLEYVYDAEKKTAALAYRDPEGKVGISDGVDIDGKRFIPRWPGPFIQVGAVLFASELGKLKDTKELAAIIEMFIRKWYLLENRYMYRLVAYYVLMTWIYDAFTALCYLRATGEAGAGKSEMMKRVGPLCYRFMPASGATTASSFFRAIQEYRGTLFIDEADLHDGGDMSNDLVKVLNLGAMKGGMIWRLEEVVRESGKSYEVTAFNTYGPKLIAMRKEFRDDAVGSRSLTLKLMPREPTELKAAGVPLQVNAAFHQEALAIRNMLLAWRLHVWQPEIELYEEDIDLEISSRLNQVTMPIKAMARNDPELRAEIERFLRAYNQETVLSRSMTIAARIVEAMWKIHQYPDLKKKYLQTTPEGQEFVMVGDVRQIANDLMDEMNGTDKKDDDDKKRRRDELTAKGTGSVIRHELQLSVGNRRGNGYPVFWDAIKMDALAKRYGVDVSELPGVADASGRSVAAPQQVQEREVPWGADADDVEHYLEMGDEE